MRTALRGIIGLVGVFNLVIGLAFLLAPAKAAAGFFLSPIGTQGLATLRADFPGFFIGASLFALAGAWRCDAGPLRVPMVMLGLALAGRCVSVVADGLVATTVPPMLVEALMLALLFAGTRVFGTAGQNA